MCLCLDIFPQRKQSHEFEFKIWIVTQSKEYGQDKVDILSQARKGDFNASGGLTLCQDICLPNYLIEAHPRAIEMN